MSKKALLVIDVQKDFCPGGALAVNEGDAVVAPLVRMIQAMAAHGGPIFASRDWHPPNTRHFAKFGGVWPPHCVQNSPGAEFHPDMAAALQTHQAVVVSTGERVDEDGYSAFDGRTPSGELLENALHARGVDEILLGGLATDYCVKCSALDAARKGFRVRLLVDACRAVNLKPGDAVKAIDEMRRAGVEVTTTEEAQKLLET